MTSKEQDQLYKDLGIRIREARERAGFKQGNFAQMLNLSRASVVNIEKGRQRPPLYLIYEIGKITKTDLTEILPIVSQKNSESKKLKSSWHNIVSESLGGDKETKEKVIKFLKEVTTNKEKNATIPEKD